MASRLKQSELPLIVIAGPTASGKTALAIELAEQLGGEIICADSRTIYKGMDIGTAKPTDEERARVPHWGLDLVRPDEPFTVSDFKRYADDKIAEVRARGKVPFLVGGSGLYIDAVIFDYSFGGPADASRRKELESYSLEALHEYCKEHHIELPENSANKRYIVRAIERHGRSLQRRSTPISTSLIVGIATNRGVLQQRISERSEQLFTQGVVEEATLLGEKYGWSHEAMTGNIYPLVHSLLKGELSVQEVKTRFATLDYRLAKRQLTWLRRNPYIIWLMKEDAPRYIKEVLAVD